MEIGMLLLIAWIGLLVGVISNLDTKVFGNMFVNFGLIAIFTAYQSLAEILGLPLVPIPVIVFVLAYFVGTFASRILGRLGVLPTP